MHFHEGHLQQIVGHSFVPERAPEERVHPGRQPGEELLERPGIARHVGRHQLLVRRSHSILTPRSRRRLRDRGVRCREAGYPVASSSDSSDPNSSRTLAKNDFDCGCASSPARVANCSSSSRCFLVSFSGTSTVTRTCWSPRWKPFRCGIPFPRRRKTFPLCVPEGIFIFTLPSRVGTSMVAPSAAWVKLIGTAQMTSVSSRMKIGCSWTCTTTYRSPGGPPRSPGSPSPVSLRRVPVSTPGGTLTLRTLSVSTFPAPRQVPQGSVMTLPD